MARKAINNFAVVYFYSCIFKSQISAEVDDIFMAKMLFWICFK